MTRSTAIRLICAASTGALLSGCDDKKLKSELASAKERAEKNSRSALANTALIEANRTALERTYQQGKAISDQLIDRITSGIKIGKFKPQDLNSAKNDVGEINKIVLRIESIAKSPGQPVDTASIIAGLTAIITIIDGLNKLADKIAKANQEARDAYAASWEANKWVDWTALSVP